MKTLLVVALLIAGIFALHTQGYLQPHDRRPGLALIGEVVREPVTDWSFTAQHREILIETQTPYRIPHSVTIVCADADGQLFIGARNPVGKLWVGWVERDPNVRLKVGDRVYEVELSRITEPAELERVRTAYAAKLGAPMENVSESETVEVWYWRVDPRT